MDYIKKNGYLRVGAANIFLWKTRPFPFGAFGPIFRGEIAVSFRECTVSIIITGSETCL